MWYEESDSLKEYRTGTGPVWGCQSRPPLRDPLVLVMGLSGQKNKWLLRSVLRSRSWSRLFFVGAWTGTFWTGSSSSAKAADHLYRLLYLSCTIFNCFCLFKKSVLWKFWYRTINSTIREDTGTHKIGILRLRTPEPVHFVRSWSRPKCGLAPQHWLRFCTDLLSKMC